MLNKIIKFLIENKLVSVLLLLLFIGWGIINAPFNWDTKILPNYPVPVDAIPDIGENQQIVITSYSIHYTKLYEIFTYIRYRINRNWIIG